MTMNVRGWGLLALSMLAGCRGRSETWTEVEAPARTQPVAPVSATATPAGDPQAMLDLIDTRTPVPLLPTMAHHQKQNMRDHLAAVQEIVAAVASKDFAAVDKAASRIGFSETMGQMCTHMGAGAPGFTDLALKFHHDADEIGKAARKSDAEGVLTSLGRTLSQCTGCHAQYKQRVLDERGWSRATGAAAPPHRHVE